MRYILIILVFLSVGAKAQMVIKAHANYRPYAQPAANLLLDDYPNAAAAYSLRKLDKDYTGAAIRVRKDTTGQPEQDIFFVGNELDTVGLKNFLLTRSGFVTTWYDQSGNGRNATQSTQANQPRIALNGVINYNSKNTPTLTFDGSNDVLTLTAISMSNYSFFIYYGSTSGRVGEGIVSDDGSSTFFIQRGGNSVFQDVPIGFTANNTFNTSGRLVSTHKTGGVSGGIIAFNGVVQTITPYNFAFTNFQRIGQRTDGLLTLNGNITEIIFYNSNQSSNRTGIESNINTYYGIY